MKVSNVALRGVVAVGQLFALAVGLEMLGDNLAADAQQLNLGRGDATVLVEAYASNIVRVSLSLRRDDALAGPGYGFSGKGIPGGWVAEKGELGDVLRSSRMVV